MTTTEPDTGQPDRRPRRPTQRGIQIVDLYSQGLTFQAIGDQLGITRQTAHETYWATMDAVRMQTVDAHRAVMIEEITEVIRVAKTVMHGEHVAHSNGRVVRDDDGTAVIDDGPKLNAAHVIIAAHARLSRLIGADAPTKTDLGGGLELNYTIRGVDTDKL